MLKRKGQLCQHGVPDYSGRLTDAEFLAYNTVFAPLEHEVQQVSAIRDSINQLEASLSRLLDAGVNERVTPLDTVRGNDGAEWQVIEPLLKPPRSEVLWCKQAMGSEVEFAIIERLSPNSPLAKAQGPCEVQMTSHDPKRLIQDFIRGQREMLQLWVYDIVANVRESLEERFSGQNLSRVVKAIAQRCTKEASPKETIIPSQQRRRIEGLHV